MKTLRIEWTVYLFVLSSFAWVHIARGEDADAGAADSDRAPATVKQLKNARGTPKNFNAMVKHPAWQYSSNSWDYLKPRPKVQGQEVKLGPISTVQSGRTQAMGRPFYTDAQLPEGRR